MQFELHKTNQGKVFLMIRAKGISVTVPMKIVEAMDLAKKINEWASPSKTFDLPEDEPVPDGTIVQPGGKALQILHTSEGMQVQLSFLSDDLFVLKETFVDACDKILSQVKRILDPGAMRLKPQRTHTEPAAMPPAPAVPALPAPAPTSEAPDSSL